MLISIVNGKKSYIEYLHKNKNAIDFRYMYLNSLKPSVDCDFVFQGYSYTAGKVVNFLCDFMYSSGFPEVNWRERLVCPQTGMNSRVRASVQAAESISGKNFKGDVYIMEQTTQLYAFLKSKNNKIIGSEFLGNEVPLGAVDGRGFRNEDATQLSFCDGSLDLILSFDVFEHIYECRSAFRECYRVLRDGGEMIFSVPFAPMSESNIERAVLRADGHLEHLLPPEFHGDPLSSDGVLCFRHYGWALLDDLRAAGFLDASALIMHSISMGYPSEIMLFYCRKRRPRIGEQISAALKFFG